MIETDIRTDLYLDQGPVWDAGRLLIERSTLRDHVLNDAGEGVAHVWHDPEGVPFALWGSGTQALWRLLSAMAYSSETVSLYDVLSRTDARNSRAVADAVAVMAGVTS